MKWDKANEREEAPRTAILLLHKFKVRDVRFINWANDVEILGDFKSWSLIPWFARFK